MKKLFAILLAVALLCTMSLSAFANTVDIGDSVTEQELKVKYAEGQKTDIYAASITWESMEFTYSVAGQTWDPNTMTWKDNSEDATGWSSSTITVSNKSSGEITVKFKYQSETDAKGVDGYWVQPDNGESRMKAQDNGEPQYKVEAATAGTDIKNGTPTVVVFTITPDGTYTGTNTEAVKVGTITITLE